MEVALVLHSLQILQAGPDTTYWTDIGYSEGGFSLEYDKTFEDVMVAEEIDPIKTIKTAQEVRVTGELAQASLSNLKLAMAVEQFLLILLLQVTAH